VLIHVTDWTVWYTVIFIISVALTPINLWFAQQFDDSEIYGGVLSEVVLRPIFILEVFLIGSVFGLFW
jgi:hypothetical protein